VLRAERGPSGRRVVYFRQKVIGHITQDGTAEISNKIIKRASAAKLFQNGAVRR